MKDKLTDRSPLHTQLREVIRAKIDEGEYPPGTCIPSESQLSEAYGLNRLSVRSALAALEYEGLLHSVQGKGVFVTAPKLERDMETLGGFRQTMRERSQRPGTRVLLKALRQAGPLYAPGLCPGRGHLVCPAHLPGKWEAHRAGGDLHSHRRGTRL